MPKYALQLNNQIMCLTLTNHRSFYNIKGNVTFLDRPIASCELDFLGSRPKHANILY